MNPRFDFDPTVTSRFLIVADSGSMVEPYMEFLSNCGNVSRINPCDQAVSLILSGSYTAVVIATKGNKFIHSLSSDVSAQMANCIKAAHFERIPLILAYKTVTSGSYNLYHAEYISTAAELRGITNPINHALNMMKSRIADIKKKKMIEDVDNDDEDETLDKSSWYDDDLTDLFVDESDESDLRILLFLT